MNAHALKKGIFVSFPFILLITAFFMVGFMDANRIGFVDASEIVAESDAGKDASAKLEGFIETKKAEIEEKRSKLLSLQQELQEKKDQLSESELKEHRTSFLQARNEFEQFVNMTRRSVNAKYQELTNKLLPEVYKIIRRIGHENGYTTILDINTGKVIYHTANTDVTSTALQQFNEAYNMGEISLGGSQ